MEDPTTNIFLHLFLRSFKNNILKTSVMDTGKNWNGEKQIRERSQGIAVNYRVSQDGSFLVRILRCKKTCYILVSITLVATLN